MSDYSVELINHTLRLRYTAEAYARLTAHADRWGRRDGLGERYFAFSDTMMVIGNISAACLLRAETADDRVGTELWYRQMRGVIPEGVEITVIGELPPVIGMCPVLPQLFCAPVTSETVFPRLSPDWLIGPIWTMSDYLGHLGSHVPPRDLGGAGGGRYPGVIDAGWDCRALLDGIYYWITTPYLPESVPHLRELPGAEWHVQQRAWRVKKRWHRVIRLALEEIAELERVRVEHLWSIARDTGRMLEGRDWVRPGPDGIWTVRIPPGRPTAALLDLLRSVWVRLDRRTGEGTVARRWAPSLALIADEVEAEIAPMAAAHQATIDAAEARRQSAAVAAALDRQAEAERRRWRVLLPVDACPAVGAEIEVRGQRRRVVSLGQPFGGETVPSVRGPIVTPVTRYAYTEPAP